MIEQLSLPDGFQLPPDFLFGVATAGFQTEGGYNGHGEPANNWVEWERTGRVEPSGIALDFWGNYEFQLDRAVAAGCNAFRLSVEWARCVPTPDGHDASALAGYGRILAACRQRGLEPLVTLHHFTHPAWLGEDFWLASDAPERFAEWATLAVTALAPYCTTWVTINEINVFALQSYFVGLFPPGRRGDITSLVRAMDHLLTAHVLAYDAIHSIQPHAIVATNTYSLSAYETDRLLVDILMARSKGVERAALPAWLQGRSAHIRRAETSHGPAEMAVRQLAARCIPLDKAFPRAVAATYASSHDRTLDVSQIDFYEPRVDHKLRVPGHRSSGGRNWMPVRLLWDDPPDPSAFTRYCQLNHEPGMDLWVAENGLCNRVRRGVSIPRRDGWDRVRYLNANIAAMVQAMASGVAVGAYFHWCLADNYEWGTYEPRFGLYGVDRERGLRWSSTDAMGQPAAEAYARIITRLRTGNEALVNDSPARSR